MEPTKTLIFLHIPKTAGTTLNSVLDREYGRKQTFVVDGDNLQESISHLAELPLESRREIKLLRGGHFYFGIHRLIPSPSTYITILREPVNRVVSHYYHVLRIKWHPLHDLVTSSRMSLEDFVSSGITIEMDNLQTRQLAGAEDVPFGQCTRSLLDEAVGNMNRHFSFVGLTEFFDQSLIHLRDILGWRKRPLYVHKLRNKKKPPLIKIPDKTLATIREHNELDCRLFEQVKLRFEGTASPEAMREIMKFQRANLLYSAIKKAIAAQNSVHRPLVKRVEKFLKSHRNRPSHPH